MPDVFQYYGRFQNVRGQFGTLPPWARTVVGVFAIPGILLAGLSLVLFLVSILALFLLTAPVYRLLQVITGGGSIVAAGPRGPESPIGGGIWSGMRSGPSSGTNESRGRKSVQVRVVE